MNLPQWHASLTGRNHLATLAPDKKAKSRDMILCWRDDGIQAPPAYLSIASATSSVQDSELIPTGHDDMCGCTSSLFQSFTQSLHLPANVGLHINPVFYISPAPKPPYSVFCNASYTTSKFHSFFPGCCWKRKASTGLHLRIPFLLQRWILRQDQGFLH